MGDTIMTALKPEYMEMLKRVLEERFVKSKFLPNLQDDKKRPEDLHKKNLSRAFSAFLSKKQQDQLLTISMIKG